VDLRPEVKKRGEKKLGNPKGAKPLLAWLKEHGRARRIAGTVEKANRFALDVAPILQDIEASGTTSLEGIAREFTHVEWPSSGGEARFVLAPVPRAPYPNVSWRGCQSLCVVTQCNVR
jgi:hypothetical protein